jgi:hypothetical protein
MNLVQCEIENILCKSHGLGVYNAVEIMTLAAFAYLLAFQLMGAASLGLVSLAMTLPVSILVFFALSHGVSPWCFPASIPVCLFDDVIDISEDTFAKHIAWPQGLSQRDSLERLDGVLNCKDLGFTDFFVSLEFYLQTTFNERALNNMFIKTYYELFSVARKAREAVKLMDKEDVAHKSCASINRAGGLALVLTAACVVVILAHLLPTVVSAIFLTLRTYVTLLFTAVDDTRLF